MKKITKRALGIALGITLGAVALTTLPFALVSCVNEDKSIKLPAELLDEVHSCVNSALSSLTNFNNQDVIEKEVINKVNQIIEASGVSDLKMDSIKLDFMPSDDGKQKVTPTLIFNNSISGSNQDLHFNGDKLSTVQPIDTLIPNDLKQDQIHLNDVEVPFWTAITNIVNSSWKDETIKDSLQKVLTTKVNEVVEKLGVSVIESTIELTSEVTSSYKEASVRFKFDKPIATTNNPNWKLEDEKTLVTRKIKTGISNTITVTEAWNLSSFETQMYNSIIKSVNNNLSDIYKIDQVQNQILNDVNTPELKRLGIIAVDAKINLKNSSSKATDGYKVAEMSITFNNNVVGTTKYFQAAGNTLTLKTPIQTGISNLSTLNGWDLSSIESQIMRAVTNNVRTTWEDIRQIADKQNAILNSINKPLLSPYGVKASSVKIDLEDNFKTGKKNAQKITITFTDKVVGTTQYFNASGNTLTLKTPIQTGISNLSTLNGFDLSGLEQQIWNVINEKVSSLSDIYELDATKTYISSDINAITTPHGIKMTSIDVVLSEGGAGYQVAKNIEIRFNKDVASTLKNFTVNGTTLRCNQDVQTKVLNYYDNSGSLVLRKNVLDRIKGIVDKIIGEFWTNGNQSALNLAIGNEQRINLITSLNSCLPSNFPLLIKNVISSSRPSVSSTGKLVVPINIDFITKDNSVYYNNFKIEPGLLGSSFLEYSDSSRKYLQISDVKTAVGCLYFSEETQTKLVKTVTDYIFETNNGAWNRSEDGRNGKLDINKAINVEYLKTLINSVLPSPAVNTTVKDIRIFQEYFCNPPASWSQTYEWVGIDIIFNDNWRIGGYQLDYTANGAITYPDKKIFSSEYNGENRIVVLTQTTILKWRRK